MEASERIVLKKTLPLEPGNDDVIIQPILTAICGSDISFFKGHRVPSAYPMVLGHEVVGRVLQVGVNVGKIRVGQRVVVEPNYPCGECIFCRTGRGNICPHKKSLGVSIPGCFSEQFSAPAEFCWLIPEEINDRDAVVIEPLAVSLHALRQSKVQLGDTIAVIGCGSTGLLLIHAAVKQGIRVIAHDKYEEKIKLAENLGAEANVSDDMAAIWLKRNVNTIFECAGSSATVELALNNAPRGSQIILMGLSTSTTNFQPLRFVREGLNLQGSLIYDHPADFANTIALVEEEKLIPSMIISKTFPFDEINDALEFAGTGKASKVVLKMGD